MIKEDEETTNEKPENMTLIPIIFQENIFGVLLFMEIIPKREMDRLVSLQKSVPIRSMVEQV